MATLENRAAVRKKVLAGAEDTLEERGRKGLDAWLTDVTVDRYIVANNGVVDDAVGQLTETWTWRVESQPRWLCCHLCIRDPMAHSLRAVGFDALQRVVLYSSFAASKNRYEARANVLHLQRCMEDAQIALDANPTGPGKWVFFIDFHGFSLADATTNTAQYAASLLKYYPERLGLVVVYDCGVMFEAFWAVVSPLLNEITKAKMCFVSTLNDDESLDPTLKNLGSEMLDWLRRETAENRTDFCETKQYWKEAGGCPCDSRPAHDPRGTKDFVEGAHYREFLSYGEGPGDDTVPVVDITVDRLFGGKLGVRLKNLTVSGLDTEEAGEFWHVGDEVLEVNGCAVGEAADFGREIREALKALPMTIKVFRHGPGDQSGLFTNGS